MNVSVILLFVAFGFSSLSQNETGNRVGSLDGKTFEVKFIEVGNADIVTSRRVMSQYAEEARPDSAEKKKPALVSTILHFDKGLFYSGILSPQQQGCIYKINTSTKDVISFEASCIIYAAYFPSSANGNVPSQRQVSTDMDAPVNKPTAAWGGTVKGQTIEGIVSWTGLDGKRIYYYYSGNASLK